MYLKLLCTFLFFSCFVSSAQVVINEIDPDTPGTDVLEFVELKSTVANFSLNGYVLVFFNAGNSAPYSNSVSYFAMDLDGYTTDINGIANFGTPTLSPTPIATFPNQSIQNGPDVVALYQANATDFPINTLATTTNLIDAIAYSNSGTTQPTAMMTTLGISVCTNENATSNVTTHSIQRKNDGTYEVKLPTPGVNNDGSGVVLNYITVAIPQTSYVEGENIPITFSTSQPVTGTDLIFNFTIVNGNFMVNDYSGTNLTVSIPVGTSSVQNTVYLFDDITDEGDEEMLVNIPNIPFGYVLNNNNITLRIYDNDFVVQPYGTPLNPTYNTVAPTIPVGYYDSLEGLSGSALKQAVQDIIANPAVVRLHSYADIWDIIRIADQNPQNSNQVWCMYIEAPMDKLDQQVTSSGVGKWNREHIFARERAGMNTPEGDFADGINFWTTTNANNLNDGNSDAHHIRAENALENTSRGTKNFGNVTTTTTYSGYSGNFGSWKGDVARALFYMGVRYNGLYIVNGNPVANFGSDIPSYQIGDLATLLTWNTTDPRDDFEMNRNNYIYTWQMNRNPFIDHPNLADYIFGANFGQPWSSTLSTDDVIFSDIAIYPNPASDYLIVTNVQENSKVEIFTLTGQLVQSEMFDNQIRLSLNLKTGLYLVKVTNQTGSITKKIIVK